MTIKVDGKQALKVAWKCSTDAKWPFEEEVRFDPVRKWRFDFAVTDGSMKLAVEVEGIVYHGKGGRHQRGAGLDEDCRKYLSAMCLGWTIIRVTLEMINADPVGLVEQILAIAERLGRESS